MADCWCRPCLCASVTDRKGRSIKELEDVGPDSFRHLIDTRVHSECTFEQVIPY